ncbi:DUF7221 family queuine tRNA-ribosyltransferase-like protein [Saliphagus infecundisoli]|uniref:DeoxyPurine in DNA protein A domain-containing protein n=1 Tax=Saliphagus infecundisoli TaxID=1849069 RepID=A0ABD5QCR0_9EURY|nr:hypothetical protein [Saliphagus infecundisoli]
MSVQTTTASTGDELTFFFGAAGGSAQKALRTLGESNVMLSYQTKNNRPWDGIETLFIDSGGYSLMLAEGTHERADPYLITSKRSMPTSLQYRDFPCEPAILDEYERSVETHQRLTVEAAAEVLVRADERGIDAEPVTVVQGWEPEEYVHHVELLEREGCLTEHVGIGSVCRRNATDEIRDVIRAVDQATPPRTKLHAFGVKLEALRDEQVRNRLWSADSTAYDYWVDLSPLPHWQAVAREYLDYKEKILRTTQEDEDALPTVDPTQQTLGAAAIDE